MSVLSATATISAVDNASGVFAKVAANARRAAQSYKAASQTISGVGSPFGAGGMLGMATAGLSLASFGHNEYEWDKAVHRFLAQSELSTVEWKGLQEQIRAVSNETGIGRLELLDAAQGWKESGASLSDFSKSMSNYATTAKITKITVKEAALESRGLMLAFGEDVSDPKAVKDMENFFLVASKNIKGGAHSLIEVAKSAAPIMAKLHVDKASMMAMASVGVAEGFQPGEIGRALKTVPMRMMAPSRDALMAMQTSGIDMMKLYGLDPEKLKDTSRLTRALSGIGMEVTDDVRKVIAREMANPDFSQGYFHAQERLQDSVSRALGIKKGDAMNRGRLKKAIDTYFKGAGHGLSLEELFKSNALGMELLSPIFGKEHAAKVMAIFRQEKLFEKIRDQIKRESEGAIDRKRGIMFEGFAFELDRVKASWENFLGSIGGSGIKGNLSGMFREIGNILREAQSADPKALQTLFWGLAGIAAVPVAGLWLAGASAAIGSIAAAGATFAASPFWMKAIAAGGLGVLLLGDMGKLFEGGFKQVGDDPFATMGKSPALELFESTKSVFKELGTAVSEASTAARDLLNLDPKGSTLLTGVQTLTQWLDLSARSFRDLRGAFKGDPAAGSASAEHPWIKALKEWKPVRLDPFGMDEKGQPRMLRDVYGPPVPPDLKLPPVEGTVQGKMDVNITVKVDGNGQVTSQTVTGGDVAGRLNTGKSMPDVGNAAGYQP